MQAHVDVMEALELIGGNGNRETIEEMKLWLIKAKTDAAVEFSGSYGGCCVCPVDEMQPICSDNQGDVRIVIANEVLETVSPSKTTRSWDWVISNVVHTEKCGRRP